LHETRRLGPHLPDLATSSTPSHRSTFSLSAVASNEISSRFFYIYLPVFVASRPGVVFRLYRLHHIVAKTTLLPFPTTFFWCFLRRAESPDGQQLTLKRIAHSAVSAMAPLLSVNIYFFGREEKMTHCHSFGEPESQKSLIALTPPALTTPGRFPFPLTPPLPCSWPLTAPGT